MINSFKDFLVEETKTVYFTFGRMNPPTIGHEKLMDKLSDFSDRNPYFIFLSQSQNSSSNPLDYSQKVKHARKMFPKHGRKILINKTIKTVFDAATKLYDQGYKNIAMVVGSDRVTEFQTLLSKYNGKKGRHGFYNFKTIKVISAGERDPDADDVSGMSASKQRENAKKNDFTAFSQGLPKQMSNRDARKLFNDVRTGMGLSEQTKFKKHVSLETVSDTREKYIEGNLFSIGDVVTIKESHQEGTITWLGSNYVIVKIDEERSIRKWIDDVEKKENSINMNTEAKKTNYTGMTKYSKKDPVAKNLNKFNKPATHKDRKKDMKRGYNKHKGMEEQITASKVSVDHMKVAMDRIKREKEADKKKHDNMLDRARLRQTKQKNSEPIK